ncbi:UNVERIFIED_CONTAM: hypothetical protein GTU68_002680 [Idotea baltica]|nr:hypothetical protein [Idotea baltica]
MGLMLFCALFNYTIVRDIKDALVVKAAGAETISFIKFWVVMPLAVCFVFLYTKASNIFSRENLFYVTIIPFILFFATFGFIFYPNREFLLPSQELIMDLLDLFPSLRWFIMMYAKWIYVMFYACSELWGSVVVALLFWQFANQTTKISEAKRFYAMFGLLGNFGLVLSGQTLKFMTIYGYKIVGAQGNPFDITLKYILGIFTFFGILFVYLYKIINRQDTNSTDTKKREKKKKPSMSESLKLVLSSKYLFLIFMLVMSYGVSINLVEVTWKKQLGYAFSSMNEYAAFMGDFSTYTGLITIILMFIGTNIVQYFGWFTAAIITPIMLILTSSVFFGVLLFKDYAFIVTEFFNTTPVLFTVIIGAIQNILTKASKYSLFDSTKEMSYIPLENELKVKGKAAVDVIGGRAGKSLGSVIQQSLLMFLASGSVDGQEIIAPYLFFIIVVIIFAWIISIYKLNTLFLKKSKDS